MVNDLVNDLVGVEGNKKKNFAVAAAVGGME